MSEFGLRVNRMGEVVPSTSLLHVDTTLISQGIETNYFRIICRVVSRRLFRGIACWIAEINGVLLSSYDREEIKIFINNIPHSPRAPYNQTGLEWCLEITSVFISFRSRQFILKQLSSWFKSHRSHFWFHYCSIDGDVATLLKLTLALT